MAGINPKEFIDELVFCIKEEDIVKAKALLQFASDADIEVSFQQQALMILGKAPDSLAFPLLEHLTKIEIASPEFQETLYELILDKAYGNTDLVIRYISQNDKKNCLIYLKAAGDLMLIDAGPAIQDLINTSLDNDILIQAVTSLGAFRQIDLLPLFTNLVKTAEAGVQHAAIFAMAEISGKDAVDSLSASITGRGEIDLMVIEALSGIQDQYALDKLASLLSSPHTHVRDAAIDQLIAIGQKSVPILTRAAANAESDYMVHLVTTLGYIGDQSALPVIIDIVNFKPKDPNIRQAAYEALERIPSPKSAICLAQGLQDPVEAVRMSAARAVDKNLSKVLVAGLKNIAREENEDAQNAVAALIDAKADNIFNFVLNEESFQKLAKQHITTKADQYTRKHFLELLKEKNGNNLADEIEDALPAGDPDITEQQHTIFVVDDSKMMLRLYQNKLTQFGYKPTLFEFPEEAISAVLASKPDLVITDLNMPKINGVQLTQEIRKKYTRKALPIVMITTQSDFLEAGGGKANATRVDESYLSKSGINKILHKPFTDEDLQKNVALFLK